MSLAKTEAMLFKGGSGAGSNLSRIRSSKERLAGGGTASGPVSFMRGFDAFAGVVKSGGKTRRAAKMVILNADHPDILEFIRCKSEEEKKAWLADRFGLRRRLQRAGRRLRLRLLPEREPLRARDGCLHALRASGRELADAQRHDGRGHRHVPGPRRAAGDGRGDARLRRSGHPVRHHDQSLEPGQGLGAHPLEQSVLRVHVPRRHGLQSGEPEPDALPRAGRPLRGRSVPPRGRAHDPGAGDPRRPRGVSDAADRAQQPSLPSARARLREPRRAADGVGPALRRRRRAQLRGVDHVADVWRGLPGQRRDRRGDGAVRALSPESRPASSR